LKVVALMVSLAGSLDCASSLALPSARLNRRLGRTIRPL
jgi:hypothetical protein